MSDPHTEKRIIVFAEERAAMKAARKAADRDPSTDANDFAALDIADAFEDGWNAGAAWMLSECR